MGVSAMKRQSDRANFNALKIYSVFSLNFDVGEKKGGGGEMR